MASIHRPLGHGPSTLPLCHTAFLSSLVPIHALITESRGRDKYLILHDIDTQSLWRNRLARTAVTKRLVVQAHLGMKYFFHCAEGGLLFIALMFRHHMFDIYVPEKIGYCCEPPRGWSVHALWVDAPASFVLRHF
jgi:hypothetical protein